MDIRDYWVKYPERYNPEGRVPTSVWHIPIPRQGSWGEVNNLLRHECPLPPELVRRILELTTRPGDVVLDPFAGSGSVLGSANAMGRHFIGFDLNAAHPKSFHQRVLPKAKELFTESPDLVDRKAFKSTVVSLRALKFGKSILPLAARHGAIGVIVVPGTGAVVHYLYIIPSDTLSQALLKSSLLIASKPPLSKYGIRAKFECLTLRNLGHAFNRLQVRPGSSLFIYERGRFFRFSKRLKRKEFSAFCKGRDPKAMLFLASTISVSLETKDPLRAFAIEKQASAVKKRK